MNTNTISINKFEELRGKSIYCDQNALQYIIENFDSSQVFKEILDKYKIVLYLSALNIYEFARLFIEWKNMNLGKKIFSFIYDLFDNYPKYVRLLQDANVLLHQEKEHLTRNVYPLFEYSQKGTEYYQETLKQIYRLSQGEKDKKYKTFLNKGKNLPIEFNEFKTKVLNYNKNKRISNINDYIKDNKLKKWLFYQYFNYKTVSDFFFNKLINNPDKYVFLDRLLKSNIFITYHIKKNEHNNINYKFPLDIKHYLLASYSDILLTNDQKMIKRIRSFDSKCNIMGFDF